VIEDLKRQAAEAALAELQPGMLIGLGTGSTARHFVELLGIRVAQGYSCQCVPTSAATATQAQKAGIPLTDLEANPQLDLTVDGADEIGPGLDLIKGAGGALLREKIVAAASSRMVVIADASKKVEMLGRFPLPIEIEPFGAAATLSAIAALMSGLGASGKVTLRMTRDTPILSDGGHLIADASFGRISSTQAVAAGLEAIAGVIGHGLFVAMCDTAYVATEPGVEILQAPPRNARRQILS
jgi:ribose 5-phosphate isomerase A